MFVQRIGNLIFIYPLLPWKSFPEASVPTIPCDRKFMTSPLFDLRCFLIYSLFTHFFSPIRVQIGAPWR